MSGNIGIYEMPEYTAFEVDEPDDWIILEKLMQKHILSRIERPRKIKLFISDVDGTLTDGGMYYAEPGYELKNSILVMEWAFSFCVRQVLKLVS